LAENDGPNRAVFFDRDGVLNSVIVRDGRAYGPVSIADFELNPWASSAVSDVQDAGFLAVLITNQPESARGNLPDSDLAQMHDVVRDETGMDAIYVCPHLPESACGCHKPDKGMFEDAARDLGINLRRSYMIGDRWRDVGAGNAAGCTTVLISRDYSFTGSPVDFSDVPDHHVVSLKEAVQRILDLEPRS
jgi:D-glycero-D-manno-heptose 1,7-bisphosphate phosphatase